MQAIAGENGEIFKSHVDLSIPTQYVQSGLNSMFSYENNSNGKNNAGAV